MMHNIFFSNLFIFFLVLSSHPHVQIETPFLEGHHPLSKNDVKRQIAIKEPSAPHLSLSGCGGQAEVMK